MVVAGTGNRDLSSRELLFAAYAAGQVPCAVHALVASHLEISPENRAFVASLEESLAQELTVDRPCSAVRAREARLDAIFCCDQLAGKTSCDSDIPRALRHYLGRCVDDMPYRTLLPGIRECRIDGEGGFSAMLYRIAPGKKIPQHSHEGTEITLVLRGGFSDETGHYVRGDIAMADGDVDHIPVADRGEECVCFAVLDAPLRLTGPVGRLLNRFIR